MNHPTNNDLAQLIRIQIEALQKTLAALEEQPSAAIEAPVEVPAPAPVKVPVKAPVTVTAKEIDFDKYEEIVAELKARNQQIVNSQRIRVPKLVNHVNNVIELYFELRTLMLPYKRTNETYKRLFGLAKVLSNLLASQEPRLKASLRFQRSKGVPDIFVDECIKERRRSKRIFNKGKDLVIKGNVNPLDILTDIATTFNSL